MKSSPTTTKLLNILSGTLVMVGLSGCGFFVFPNNQATFSTGTKVFLDSSNLTSPIMVLPRPYQPIKGNRTSGSTPTSPNNNTIFGSTSGNYTVYTDNTGNKTVDYLAAGTWNIYYNWLPEPDGCKSENGPPQVQTPAGDWNINAAPFGDYIATNASNPLTISYTENSNGTITYNAPTFYCNMVAEDLAGTDSPLVTMSAPPANLTVTLPGGTATSAPATPYNIEVVDHTGAVVSNLQTAQSVPPGATALSFPFPTTSSGNALPTGIYGTFVSYMDPVLFSSEYLGGEGYFFIGSANPNIAHQPFGVAVQDIREMDTECYQNPPLGEYSANETANAGTEASPQILPPNRCTTSSYEASYPVVTSFSDNTLTAATGTIPVGQQPIEVLTYGTAPMSVTTFGDPGDGFSGTTRESDIDQTGYALVVNHGSNNVSIVDLVTLTTVATVPVGNAPTAAAIDSTNSYAYVTNYSDSTVSKISLTNYSVLATFATGTNPIAVTVDGSGNIWVGGNGYINEYAATDDTLMSSSVASGIINSIALSPAQGQIVSNTIQPTSQNSPQVMAMVARTNIGSPNPPSTPTTSVADAYVSSVVSSGLATPYLLGGGTVVSANYQNNLVISATPTGFILQDVHTGDVLASAATSAPIRAIAVDQNFGYAYMTIPDTNTVLTFPLPGGSQ